jgi:hypothetical protein
LSKFSAHLKMAYDKNRMDPICEYCVVRNNLSDCANTRPKETASKLLSVSVQVVAVGHERVDDDSAGGVPVIVAPAAADAGVQGQDAVEGVSEVGVEDGVDDRVEGGVGVALEPI